MGIIFNIEPINEIGVPKFAGGIDKCCFVRTAFMA
jgi:hypothetical protein